MDFKEFYQSVFSVSNIKNHKMLKFLGLKFKFKYNKNCNRSFFEYLFSVTNSFDKRHKIITVFGIKFSKKRYFFPKNAVSCSYKSNISKRIKRLAIFASYSNDGIIHDYVVYYLKELSKVCDGIIFVADNPIIKSEIGKIKDYVIYAQFKRHNEYDFGSYKKGFIYAKKQGLLKSSDELLLCNDSCFGPIYPLDEVFNRMSKQDCDFWGMIHNSDIKPHLQSWFMLFKKNILKSNVLESFLCSVKKEKSFWDVVLNYEFELTDYLVKHGYKYSSYLPLEVPSVECSEMQSGFRNKMIFPFFLTNDLKFPFVKVKVFTSKMNNNLRDNISDVLALIKEKNPNLFECVSEFLTSKNIKDCLPAPNVYTLIKNNDVISFDIFDTLLIRPYLNPTDLFLHIENFYAASGFARERVKAEKRARLLYCNKEEITLDDIYNVILPKFADYKIKELEFEYKTLRKHPEHFNLYNYAKILNKKIIITSDMYLPESFLKSVLIKNGYDNFEKLYVSSHYCKTKGSGSLFKQISADYKNNTILHIGDNKISDGTSPKSVGVNSFTVKSYREEFCQYKGNSKYMQFVKKNNSLQSSVIVSAIAKHQLFNEFKNYWYQIGYYLGGPLAIGYVRKIIKEVELNKIDTLLFVARDGYILQKVYNLLAKNPVENRYVYAPRVLNLSCFGDYKNNNDYFENFVVMLRKVFPAIHFSNNLQDNLKILNYHSSEINEWLNNNRRCYEMYLKSLNITGQNIASVDMTTGAFTSSTFLEKFFYDRFAFGFYSGTFLNNDKVKYITYNDRCFVNKDTEVLNVMELLISSPEAPVCGVENGRPLYSEPNDYEISRIKIIREIEKGILAFVHYYSDLFSDIPIEFDMNTNMSLLEYFTKSLSSYEKVKFKHVYHASNLLNNKYRPIVKL